MLKTFSRYLTIWWLMSRNSFISVFYAKIALVIFLTGKILRFIFFTGFLIFLIQGTKNLAGYDLHQTLFFFLTFNLIDVSAQFLFREVYRFRPKVVSGDFDLILIKPVNALFRSLMGGADVIDLITIPPLIYGIFYVAKFLNPSLLHTTFYLLLIFNSLLIATAFHIVVLSLGIITFEIDHLIMIYRDLTSLGRFPVDIYREPVRAIITYLIPVGIMITLPAKALMGLVSPIGVAASFGLGIAAVFLATKFWYFALKKYSSASS